MFASLRCQSCQVVLFLFLPTDPSVHFTRVQKMASFSFSVQCNSSRMISLKRKTTKRFKRLFLDGYFTVTTLISLEPSKKKPRFKITLMFLTSPPWLTVSAHVCKNLTIFQRTLPLSSTTTCINLTLTSFPSQLNFLTNLELSMNPSNLFHLSLRPQCRNYKLQSFSLASKTCLPQALTCTISMNNSQEKKSKWRNSLINATTKTSNTTSRSAVTFLELVRTSATLTTPRPSSTIFFRKSSSTRAKTFHEVVDLSMLKTTRYKRVKKVRTMFQMKPPNRTSRDTQIPLPFLNSRLYERSGDAPIT